MTCYLVRETSSPIGGFEYTSMTDTNQNSLLIELTPEEKKELESKNHPLLKVLEAGSVVAPAWLAAWRQKKDIPEVAKEQAAEIRQAVISAPVEQETLFKWCGFPTDMTRVSPFFPMQTNELGKRPFMRDALITSAAWGEIRYTGPKLSIHEEDALLALLAILESVTKYRKETTVEERKTYTYLGPIFPLWKLLYGGKTKTGKEKKPSSADYKRLISSLELLGVAGVKLFLAARTKGGKRKIRYTSLSSMLANVAWDEESKVLSVTINPFFYETYYAGTVTLMDVQKRMEIKGSIAKSLYRFVQSHKTQSPLWAGHFLTLAQVLNVDIEQPAKEVRRLLKDAISELVRQGILNKKSRLQKTDIVTLFRADAALPPVKAKRLQK